MLDAYVIASSQEPRTALWVLMQNRFRLSLSCQAETFCSHLERPGSILKYRITYAWLWVFAPLLCRYEYPTQKKTPRNYILLYFLCKVPKKSQCSSPELSIFFLYRSLVTRATWRLRKSPRLFEVHSHSAVHHKTSALSTTNWAC